MKYNNGDYVAFLCLDNSRLHYGEGVVKNVRTKAFQVVGTMPDGRKQAVWVHPGVDAEVRLLRRNRL